MNLFKKSRATTETSEQQSEIFDEAQALSSVGGDREFLDEHVGLIQAAWPTLLESIRKGLARGDLRAVETTARLAKAAARNVAARKAYVSALQLETMAREGDLQAAQETGASLEREAEMLQMALAALRTPRCTA